MKPAVPQALYPFISDSLKELLSNEIDLNPAQRSALINQAALELRKSLRVITRKIGGKHLPSPTVTCDIGHLDISVRTYNCLSNLMGTTDARRIGEFTIRDVVDAPNFGTMCLVDLLAALEASNLEFQEQDPDVPTEEFDETRLVNKDWEVILRCLNEGKRVPKSVANKYFPRLPLGFRFDMQILSARTINALKELDLVSNPEKLCEFTIHDILRRPNVGKKSIAEITSNLKALFSPNAIDPELSADYTDDLMFEASLLGNLTDAEEVTVDDLRFGQLVRKLMPDALTAQECGQRIGAGERSCLGLDEASRNMRLLRKGIEDASRLNIEEEIKSVVLAAHGNLRSAEILISRYGLDGSEEKTLQEVGDTYGITRERVRQICSQIDRLLVGDVYVPTLDKVIALVEQQIPEVMDVIQANLVKANLTKNGVHLCNLHYFAEKCGRDFPLTFSELNGRTFVSRNGLSDKAMQIVSIARREIRVWGVALIQNVIELTKDGRVTESDELIREILFSRMGFQWLDEAEGWFWLSSEKKNRLITQIEKALSVCKQIDIIDLRQAVRRHYRMKGFSPPTPVLLEFCRQQKSLVVEGQTVKMRDGHTAKRSLAETETLLFEILRENGSVMKREDFEREAISRGMNRATFYVCLDNSPTITRFTRGVYGLTGSQVPVGLIESLKPKILRGRVLKDYGWTRDRNIWIGYKLSKNTVASGLLTLPSSLRKFLNPPYPVEGASRKLILFGAATLSIGTLLTERNFKSGDILILIFDISNKTASLTLGDERLLKEFQLVSKDNLED